MGKAKKHSRGISSGYVPDYIQAVEPDGFGYSHGIDNEIAESPALKRSRVSLNGGSYGVSREVFSFSKMSRSERKNLVHKLRMELEQVRDLRKKIACHSSDTILLSPYSDIHSCSDGPKRPPQENFGTFSGTQGKKRRPGRNDKQRTKKGPSRHYESAKVDVPTSSTMAAVMKECETLHSRLWSHKSGWAFRTPVDPVLLNIPDYFTVIKHPMDLGTVGSRLRKDEYSSPLDFAADVRLTFSNSIAYNPPGNQYHIMAQALSKYFESRWKSIEKKIPVIRQPVMPQTSTASLESDTPLEVAPSRKKAASVIVSKPRVEPAKLVMTDGEKKKLSQDLEELEEEFPQNIIDLLREQSGSDGQSGELEIEIDIDTLSDEVLFTVRKLLDDYLREKKKSQEKSEPCEMEIVHDSGYSNSPLHPSKGDLPIDEDVDIVGGNDPPVTSHPPLKIEKDAACRNNDGSSSGSSGSESGSSSSDSDSCSSSGSETDSIKASNPTSTEDKKEPGVGINRKGDDINSQKIVVNDSMNGQVKHDVGEKSTAMDAVDVLVDEEAGPSEIRYRAAILKNRFADTIMKAREKALTKDEKGDPEKLRIEREEFEKRLREEKLRLQAEAKAAEEAKRRAKAEAAEKVRREREQEREAARQALQKMEKTVEINEGRRFMEDLEMLRATGAEDDQLPTFMEEMIPKCSQDMLGSFKMEGNSNPLEQLGLYMKMDEDEDEDDEEDQPNLSEGEVEDHLLNSSERQALSPFGVEGEDQLVSEKEEPVSQSSQDNVNQKKEEAINQTEGEEQMENASVGPCGEEGEDQIVSEDGREEELVSQKVQDDGNYEDEKLINQNEGKEGADNVREQENGVVDKGEQEVEVVRMEVEEAEVLDKEEEQTDVVDMGEVETEVVDKGEHETAVVDIGEEENEVVDMAEVETEVVDKGEQETAVVDIGGEENEVVDMAEQETEVMGMAEQETEVSDKGKEENEVVVDMGVQGNEVVDKREQETEVMDMAGQETEVSNKGKEETEAVVDVGVEGNEVVDKKEQETEVMDMAGQETEVSNKGKEETEAVVDVGVEGNEVVDKREQETEVADKGEEETEVVVDVGLQGNEGVDMGMQETEVSQEGSELETEVIYKREEETKVLDKGGEEPEVVDKGEQETEGVDMGEQHTGITDTRAEETEVLDKGGQETAVVEVVHMELQENEVIYKGEHETEGVDMGEQHTELTDKGEEETEVLDKGEQECTDVVEEKID